MVLSPPAMRFKRAQGQEQKKYQKVEIETHIFGIDEHLGKTIEMFQQGEMRKQPSDAAARELRRPADDPEEQQKPEANGGGDDLILGERRSQRPQGDEGRPQQE